MLYVYSKKSSEAVNLIMKVICKRQVRFPSPLTERQKEVAIALAVDQIRSQVVE